MTFFTCLSSLSFFFLLCAASDGSLSTKQIVFLQRPVLGRKRRESKVRDLTFLPVFLGRCGVSVQSDLSPARHLSKTNITFCCLKFYCCFRFKQRKHTHTHTQSGRPVLTDCALSELSDILLQPTRGGCVVFWRSSVFQATLSSVDNLQTLTFVRIGMNPS